MTRSIRRMAAAAACLAVAAWPAMAQRAPAAEPLQTRLEARKVVVAADGKEGFAPAADARPGDVIEYTATYRNTTRQPLANVQATLPIPQQTEFIAGSARPAAAKASVDGATYADMPLKRKTVRNGVAVEEPVALRDYRALRWFPGTLAGEQSVSFSARVKVVDDRPPESGATKGGGAR